MHGLLARFCKLVLMSPIIMIKMRRGDISKEYKMNFIKIHTFILNIHYLVSNYLNIKESIDIKDFYSYYSIFKTRP